jgi:hypothetical protein
MSNFCLQLWFEGLRVENVEVSKMYTFMENFEFSLGNAMYVPKEEDIHGVNMHVRQQRLNHKPFTYKIEVSSDKAVDAYVRVFLLPKTNYMGMEWDMNERRHYAIELDRFMYHGTSRQHTGKVSWIITPCRLVYCYKCFGTACSSKRLITTYETTA